jgi:hypothetical protein
MEKIKVGPTITRFTNVLTNEECDFLYNFTKGETNNPIDDLNQVPWELGKSNTLYYPTIADQKVRELLVKYKHTMAEALSEDLGVKVYPHLTTLVFWKEGQQMPRHVDDGNGYPEQERNLGMRFITSVSYMNDNYEGGNTFIKNDGVNDKTWRSDSLLSFPNEVFEDYISVPEKGTTVAFLADDSNAHGVTKVLSGDRVILSTWFTKDEMYKEQDDLYISPEQKAQMMQQNQNQGSQQSWNK